MTLCAKSKNKKIIVIVGLPGSGKTHFGRHLAAQTGGLFIDDVDKNGGLAAVSKALNDEVPNLILADPNLCERVNQKNARSFLRFTGKPKGYDISWVYFENNVDKCSNNVAHRASQGDSRQVSSSIKLWSNIYYIPDGANVVGIWQPGDDSKASLNEVDSRLVTCSVCGSQLNMVELLLSGGSENPVCFQHMGECLEK